MRPGTGREVTINVTGTLDDGSKVSDRKTFRIKDIPKPTGTINGQDRYMLSYLETTLRLVELELSIDDFDFDLDIAVTSFKIKVPGQPSVACNGTRLNSQAKAALRKARRGDGIQFFDIKAKITNNPNYRIENCISSFC